MAIMSTRLNANYWLSQYGTRKAQQCPAVRVFGAAYVGGGRGVVMLLAGTATRGCYW